MSKIEFKDIQGLIVRGYNKLPASCFLLLKISDVISAKQWLTDISTQITDGESRPHDHALHIAFTYEGLSAIGLKKEILDTFALEFREGMVTDHRKRILGDVGDSDPNLWEWGNPGKSDVHILLLVYSHTTEHLSTYADSLISNFKGVTLFKKLDSDLSALEKRKEHFGFHDGISQPLIKGFNKEGDPDFMVEPGEFILGYENEYGKLPESPWLPGTTLTETSIPGLHDGSSNFDLGRNGSYLVYRQIKQDVLKFWKFIDDASRHGGPSDESKRIKLASKMVGRWPSGAPLVQCPEHDDKAFEQSNAFEYHTADPDGLKCPFGSHVRRTNPRNSLDPTPKESVMIAKKHKILRRGRPFGKFISSNDPEIIANDDRINESRGLHFICFNTNIGRQFEFIQDTWINESKFSGLYNDPDVISGNPIGRCSGQTGNFTIQAEPVRERVLNIPSFTSIIGGAYFFMPGIKTLQLISSI